MLQIIKRLELIKTSITLEDEEIIGLQINKIKSLDHNTDIDDILRKLKQNDFTSAVRAIDDYINNNTGLIPYEDQEVQGLKLELKALERQLKIITEKKNDYTINIDDFNHEYCIKLGDIILKILELRKEILYQQVVVKEQYFQEKKDAFDNIKEIFNDIKTRAKEIEDEFVNLDEFSDNYEILYEKYETLKEELNQREHELNNKRKEAKQAKDVLDSDPANNEYKKVKDDFETFNKEYEEIKAYNIVDLNENEKKILKDLYKKAFRLCHHDIVDDSLKDQANKIMSELNIAKKKYDLEKIKEILKSLQSDSGFEVASDTVNDKELLKNEISTIKDKISILQNEISELESSKTYITIQEIEDKDKYLNEIKTQLEDKYKRLQGRIPFFSG
jgi:hypothetical protein